MKIPFCLPLIDQDVINSVNYCLTETGWLTSGPIVKDFEENISKLCQTSYTVAVNSWTSGALLLLKLLELTPEDEVIVPNYTYAATALSVINHGAKCILVDVNEDFTINIEDMKSKLSKNTKAILAVDLGGLPADYISIKNTLNQIYPSSVGYKSNNQVQKLFKRPIIISDAAHSLGSTINNIPTTRYVDFSIFSFHSVKNITTGEGGAITLNLGNKEIEEKIYKELKLLSLNGQTKTALEKTNSGSWKYDIITNGLKVNMPDINAAIGLSQAKRYLNSLLPERRSIFSLYNQMFAEKDWAILPHIEIDNRKSSCHLYTLRIKGYTEHHRNLLINHLNSENIGTNVHYKPLSELSYFKSLGFDSEDYNTSMELYKNEISLPIYNGLTKEEVIHVSKEIIKYVERKL